MRTRKFAIGSAALVLSANLLVACWPYSVDDCEINATLTCFWERRATGTTGAGAGGDGGTTPGCVPSENDDPVDDACGVFVATSGDDANEGTKENPVATLGKAVELAMNRGGRVYACAETFEESLVLDATVAMYGGLGCGDGWTYVGDTQKTTLTTAADEIPLVMKNSANGAQVEDFAIHAVDAATEGGSSIAVLADGATAELVRCEIVAGNGANGAAGMPGDPNGMNATSGGAGNNGKEACSDLDMMGGPDVPLSGGAQVTNNCGGDISAGGRGGDGDVLLGGSAVEGQTGTGGKAGKGEPAMDAWDCVADSGLGGAGSSGVAGMPGVGATGLGAITASGYTGTSGGAGTPGKAGQGGGGGGGAKGVMNCPLGGAGAGASGGSGGAGGCGGLPGTGGGPGGASIALVSLNASITLTGCTLSSTRGGDGGPGGDAQGGGAGGLSGMGGQGVGLSKAACDGGKGGAGGPGGTGGGGLGGPSLGIAYIGNPVDKQGETMLTPGLPGAGGPGGSSNVSMNAGEAGIAVEEQEFPE